MVAMSTGYQNAALGYLAIRNGEGNTANTATGYAALENNANGNANTANGYGAMRTGTTII